MVVCVCTHVCMYIAMYGGVCMYVRMYLVHVGLRMYGCFWLHSHFNFSLLYQ